ncbi:MAG TPA: hypothetical protein VIG74_02570 [Alphaproteobacteria bacterium]
MKRVRSFTLYGDFEKVRDASNVGEPWRHCHDFKCLDSQCGAEFHWRRASSPLENTKEVSATFVRNPSSKHRAGCDYDYEAKASGSAESAFVQNGRLHLRINFPLGGAYSDLHPERGLLTAAQKRVAAENTGKKSAGSAATMVKFLEREFGTLENPALENLVLHYQGRSRDWNNIFVKSSEGARLYREAASPASDKSAGMLAIVKPEAEISPSAKGKPRVACAEVTVDVDGRSFRIRPLIICETAAIAQSIKPDIPLLVAVRPFISPADLKDRPVGVVNLHLYVADHTQFAPIAESYWNPAPGMQTNLFGSPNP